MRRQAHYRFDADFICLLLTCVRINDDEDDDDDDDDGGGGDDDTLQSQTQVTEMIGRLAHAQADH